jgi:hypothetical protein
MPKIRAKRARSHPEPPPEPPPDVETVDAEPLEVHEVATRRRPAAPQRVALPRAPIDVPQGAASWTIEDMSGAALGAMNADGVEVYEWPILGFTTAFVRASWGAGRYVARFKDASGKSYGRKRFALGARDAAAEAAPPPAHAAMVAPDDPITRGFQLMTALDGFAQSKAATIVDMQSRFLIQSQENAARMFEAAMGRDARIARQENAAPPPWAQQLIAGVQDLARRVAEIEGDDPDDPDAGGAEPPPFPDSWDDALSPRSLAAFAQKLPELVNTLGSIVQTMKNARTVPPPPPLVVNPVPVEASP